MTFMCKLHPLPTTCFYTIDIYCPSQSLGRSIVMAFNKVLAILLCLLLCCCAQDQLFTSRSEEIKQEKQDLVSGSDKTSHRGEKYGKQLHSATISEQRTRDSTNLVRISRQSDNPALQNLKSIAAGKGAILRVRSKARGRGPTDTEERSKITRRPIPTSKPRKNQLNSRENNPVQSLPTDDLIEESNEISEEVFDSTSEIEADLSPGTNIQENTIDVEETRPKKRRKKRPGKRGKGRPGRRRKGRPGRRRPRPNFVRPNLKEEARHKDQSLLTARDNQNEHLYNNEYVADLTGCHQVCTTLIYEVYKLLRGRHCNC